MIINNHKTLTYAECCKKYFDEISQSDQCNLICLKCSQNLQRIYSLHLDAEELKKKMRRTLCKTKRLNRIRSSNIDAIAIKQEPSVIPKPKESIISNNNSESTNSSNHVNHFLKY